MIQFPEGVLCDQQISTLLDNGMINAAAPLESGQIQPASLDLRLGRIAYRVRASFCQARHRRWPISWPNTRCTKLI